jgi:hypothetical protein
VGRRAGDDAVKPSLRLACSALLIASQNASFDGSMSEWSKETALRSVGIAAWVQTPLDPESFFFYFVHMPKTGSGCGDTNTVSRMTKSVE